jgi:AcrR family transcriptional regulator
VREAVLSAALELIGDEGLAQLTTREVARRAGVSEASVFYHFTDKVGLLHEVMLAGLEPLEVLDPDVLSGHADRPLSETLLEIATAIDHFLDRAMPVLAAVQSDAGLRTAFADRLVKGDNGPHRGVQLLAQYLTGMAESGLVDSDVDAEAAGLLLVGACFLRAWQRHLAGPSRKETLPGLPQTVQALAQLLSPATGRS